MRLKEADVNKAHRTRRAEPRADCGRPYLGYGLGLRPVHYEAVIASRPDVDWFEVLTENYMVDGGKPWYYLDRIREHYPLALHGVSLSIGGTDAINREYLQALKNLISRVEPQWVSDHLCWTGVHGVNLHDLMPLPYTPEAVAHVVSRVNEVQDFLGQPILLENVSSYVTFRGSGMQEWEFLSEIAGRSGCHILLDINNVYVSSRNHGFDPGDYLEGIPAESVWQFHLAGHTHNGSLVIDTHDQPVPDPVWALYEQAVTRFGRVSTMIERDDNIPELEVLYDELMVAREIAERVFRCAA